MPKQYFEGSSGADDNGAFAEKAKKPHPADPAERVAYTMHITGGTKDISFGQVLDRTGVALGMEFPAGGQLDLMAQKFCEAEQAEDPGEIFKGANRDMLQAAKEACRLTPVKVKDGWLNLSGLDTQARSRIDRLGLEQKQLQTYALAADLFAKTGKAASDMIIQCSEHSGRASVLLAGGVASSQFLRSHMRKGIKRQRDHSSFWRRNALSGQRCRNRFAWREIFMGLKPVTVSQLNSYIKRILQTDPILGNVSVRGEVSNLKFHGSGHVYFSLKDEKSRINCFLPSDRAVQIGRALQEGMEIISSGYIYLYERGGSYSLNVTDLEKAGQGELAIAFEKLKQKLAKEGLFDQEHKKLIPASSSQGGHSHFGDRGAPFGIF